MVAFFCPSGRCIQMDIFEPPGLIPETYEKGQHPLEVLHASDKEGRSELLLNHPGIVGFIIKQGDHLRKAFFCTKIIDWAATNTDQFKTIAYINGTTDEFTPFSIPECDLLSDQIHLISSQDKLVQGTKTCSIHKYVRDNKKTLNIPSSFFADDIIKSLKLASFPTILPLIKGYQFEEGNLDTNEFKNTLSAIHPIYEAWVSFKTGFICDGDFCDESCPLPKDYGNSLVFELQLRPDILYKSDDVQGYRKLKEEIGRYRASATKTKDVTSNQSSVPNEVAVENKTVVTVASASTESKIVTKNERLIAFLSILFSTPNYDRTGKLTGMTPGLISDEAMEILSSSASLAEQTRMLADGLNALADEHATGLQYLCRFTDMPYMSQTVLSYILQANYHSGFIDQSMESLKKSFSILCLLKPPPNDNEEYVKYINASRNTEVESLLEHPSDKKTCLRKDVFMKGQQETKEDVITLAANLQLFAKFWIKVNDNIYEQEPLVVTMAGEVADFVSTPNFANFYNKHKSTTKYLAHTIIVYMFNIFSLFVSTAKNPHAIRKFKVDGTITHLKDYEMASSLVSELLNQLRLCTVTGSLHTLFAQPPTTFPTFCPHLVKNETQKRKFQQDEDKRQHSNKKEKKGSIINNTGKRLFFPRGMEEKYCADFLDANLTCLHGDNCKFLHAVYPTGFKGDDAAKFAEYIEKTPGLSLVKKTNSDKVS